jgi:HAD superfamily hydrolase (TIGR01549 family)
LNILWDFDGTLFDTYPVFTKILKQVLNDDISENIIYDQLKISFTHTINYFNISDAQIKSYIAIAKKVPSKEYKPFKDVGKILEYANKNVIMTHSNRTEVLKILKYFGYEKYFTEIVTGDDGFPRKPDPTSYEYINRKHEIDLVIGDRLIDILPAKKIGIKACLFQNKELGADYYLNEYQNFFDVIRVKPK